ncbi:TlyA family RNA methyltransferase [Desulfatirhabdium butyrativorans]|uniref:TlyA family RNA methyltransferase n=1 Tax=Desulfatirhabdium butyrativorans TaxID=340467 RepID=UPI000552EF13|nr:TlyA family RNA methyltransferase [Desulfatirhabdium butyrativorans]
MPSGHCSKTGNPNKRRIDLMLVEQGLAESRQRAQAMIMAGRVVVAGTVIDKPGCLIRTGDPIEIRGMEMPYVSRGGIKLAEALDRFGIDVTGKICLDIGASTGGFTDCLLQRGAARVYAVDVGYGQLAWKLRIDDRVIAIERTNIRQMPKESIPEPVHFASVDVSFISLRLVVPRLFDWLSNDSRIVVLIKPQFEVGKGLVGKGGVVRDESLHRRVIDELAVFFSDLGLTVVQWVASPILGPKGNREFLMELRHE